MRKFISIVENTVVPSRNDGEKPIRVTDKTLTRTASATDTLTASLRGANNLTNTEFGRNALERMPNVLRDLEALSDTHGHLDTGYELPNDAGIEPTIRTPENLPAVVQSGLEVQDFNPTWHMVGNLPGMMLQAIRIVGKMVFGHFTTLPVEQIQMMTTAFGMNPEADVRKMFYLIKEHGTYQDSMHYDFSEHMPEYQAIAGDTDSKLYRAFGYEFLLMRDNGGHYVYGWPETSTKINKHGGDPLALTETLTEEDSDDIITCGECEYEGHPEWEPADGEWVCPRCYGTDFECDLNPNEATFPVPRDY